ncbi:MAG TPA: hypothetical protein VOA87_19235, partial [Thermoanaerobaculia bacterium]|nr:hypothetical protein [Thermoanaerobaculia bacterium]
GVREPAGATRTAAALWEILPRLGAPSGIIGWPASAPPPPSAVFALTDDFLRGGEAPPGSALPADLGATAWRLRVAPQDVDRTLVARFGPASPAGVRRALAGDLWRESLASSLLAGHPDLAGLFLVLPGLEAVSRGYFGGFTAVQFDGSKAHQNEEAAQLIASYYIHLDDFLAGLWDSAEGPRILAVVSAYGVEGPGLWGRLRREMSPAAALGGRVANSPDGVLLLYGAEIRPGALLTGAQLVDVVPTLLYGLGFPVARDFDGQVLTSAFDKGFLARHPLTFLPSYETLTGPPPRAARAATTPAASR